MTKTYTISTIQEMVDVVTPENIDVLISDLSLVLHVYMNWKAKGFKFKNSKMEWTDDGKSELTGIKFNFKKKPSTNGINEKNKTRIIIKNMDKNLNDMIEQGIVEAKTILGYPGRMICNSKSQYRERFPSSNPIFNANVCTKELGKIWFGDLDLAKKADRKLLNTLANKLNQTVYVFREMDCRFGKEKNIDFEKAVEQF